MMRPQMMIRTCQVLICVFLHLLPVGPAAALEATETPDARALSEANRALEEEVKLAGRAQIYLVLDLVDGAVLIKGRGLELHRLRVLHWHATDEAALGRPFRLQARPSLSRPKLAPGEDPAETVIQLEDMPAEYELGFDPSLVIAISPPATEQPWLWMLSRFREWTHYLSHPPTVRIRLALAKDDARSLAWSIVDGMPLIIRRPVRDAP